MADTGDRTCRAKILEAIIVSAKDAVECVKSIADHPALKHDTKSPGISLLDVKNHLMVQYMLDLTILMRRKLAGQSIADHPAIWRLIENRTFLEKIEPIKQKLNYQIQKLIQGAKSGETGELEKAKPDNFDVESDEDDEGEDKSGDEEEENDDDKKKAGIYKVPKLAPMHYTGDETAEDKASKKMEQMKKRSLSSAMIDELRREYMEEPEEIVESRDLHRMKRDKKRDEREKYEETYFVRTSVSKKEINKGKRMDTVSSLDSLLKFDNLSTLDDSTPMEGPVAKKRKSSQGKKGKGKKTKGMKKKRKY